LYVGSGRQVSECCGETPNSPAIWGFHRVEVRRIFPSYAIESEFGGFVGMADEAKEQKEPRKPLELLLLAILGLLTLAALLLILTDLQGWV
jgi:hypothetical protein